MQNTERLAKAIRERDNPYHIGTVIGIVTSLEPLTVEIPTPFGKEKNFIIDKHIKLASRLCAGDRRQVRIDTTSTAGYHPHEHTQNETAITTTAMLLSVGDRVIVSAAENAALFFILDKVGDPT